MRVTSASRKELQVILTEHESKAVELLCTESDIPEETILSEMMFEALVSALTRAGHGDTDLIRKITSEVLG
jgi:hypothetical protein